MKQSADDKTILRFIRTALHFCLEQVKYIKNLSLITQEYFLHVGLISVGYLADQFTVQKS